MSLKCEKHQPRLLSDTVQLLEIGLLGSRVLVWLEGERRTGAALEEGTDGGILQRSWHALRSPLLTRSQLRDVCAVWSHFGVVRQGSAGACVLGLGGCPVAVTVYPPGRGCLHSASRARSPGPRWYPSAESQLVPRVYPLKTRRCRSTRLTLLFNLCRSHLRGVDFAFKFGGIWGSRWFNHPPPQRKKKKKKKRKPCAEAYLQRVSRPPLSRGGRNGSLQRREHTLRQHDCCFAITRHLLRHFINSKAGRCGLTRTDPHCS